MNVFDKNGNIVKLQEIEDTGWESLYNDYQIRGRIINGIATVCLYNLPYNPPSTNNATVILTLPEKYIPTRIIYFVASKYLSDATFLNGYVSNNGDLALYFNQEGYGSFNGTVTYPVK